MCGIAGFLFTRLPASWTAHALGTAMTDSLFHRGPDDGAVWTDPEAGVVLGQRRLAIVDLSEAGHQPMASANGRWMITYNGEIYNAEDLRQELIAAGVTRYRGHSDTEVLLEAVALWGVEATLSRLIGMFAIALWDRQERRLHLIRDRLGIKPLYWTVTPDGSFLFGSTPKALRAHPAFAAALDPGALAAYLRYAYVPTPHTIHAGVHKQPPGTWLTIAPGDHEPAGPTAYWSLDAVAAAGRADPLTGLSDDGATDQLEALLSDAVKRRMIADVPLGAFLSGGVDSSTVAALMQKASTGPVRTFTIGYGAGGYGEGAYDEAAHAEAVARHLGTDHTTLTVTPQQALDLIPRLPEHWDEPFADASQIPTLLLSELTRRHVTVALSGDGGDELFAGYARHGIAGDLWPRLDNMPRWLRRGAGSAIRTLSPGAWQSIFDLLPPRLRPFAAGDRLHKLAGLLALPDLEAVYRYLVSQWQNPASLMPGVTEARPGGLSDRTGAGDAVPIASDPVAWMQWQDQKTYLPDDILTKVDRASMAVALEARVPILDHRVVEWSWRLPPHLKQRDGRSKWLLRRVLDRHVPRPLIDRPKQGFAVPLDGWLRGPLRDWAEDLLDPRRLTESGLLNAETVRLTWTEHLSGRRNHQYRLWTVLMFEAWRRQL